MAIAASDIKFKLSVTTTPGDTNAQGNVNLSLGEFMASTEITDNTLNNLFDDVTGDENAASDVEYRCIFVHNAHATLTWTDVKVWLSAEVAGGTSIAFAIDDAAATDHESAVAQADEVVNESTAPDPVPGSGYSTATSKATGLTLGNLAPGYCRAIWVRRTAANTVAVDNDGVTLKCEGDTSA